MTIDVRLLEPDEAGILDNVAEDVFDGPIDPAACAEFFADERHHLAVALDGDSVVGIASSLRYVHPDKRNEYWINELGVAPSHERQGIGTRLVNALLEHAREFGCEEAWLATEEENDVARKFYSAVGGKEHRAVYITFDLQAKDA